MDTINSFILQFLPFTEKIFDYTLAARSGFSTHAKQRSHLSDTYGIQWLGVSAMFSSFPHFVQTLELRVLAGTDESVSKFRKNQEILLANTGTTAAIISQVTVTSLQLSNVDEMHWIIRGFFYTSLVFSIYSVFLSFLKHRDISSMDDFDFRSRFKSHPQSLVWRLLRRRSSLDWFDKDPVKLNMSVVLALYLPYAFLNAAISIYFLALLLYLVFSWKTPPNMTEADSNSRNVFIFFFISLVTGYIALQFVKHSRLHQHAAVSLRRLTELTDRYPPQYPPEGKGKLIAKISEEDIEGFVRELENLHDTYELQQSQKLDEVVINITAQPTSESAAFLKALAEATDALKAATTEVKGLAKKIEDCHPSSPHYNPPPHGSDHFSGPVISGIYNDNTVFKSAV